MLVDPVGEVFDADEAWGFGTVGEADGGEGQFVAGGLLVDFAFAEAKVIRANGFQWGQWFLVAGRSCVAFALAQGCDNQPS